MSFIFRTLQFLFSRSVSRYALVGIGAASTHAATAMTFKFIFGTAPTLANFAGFIAGAIISYLGSYYYTFAGSQTHTGGHKKALPKFALVWLVGILVNVGLFKWLLTTFGVPFAINVLIAIVLTPILQYLLLRFWAFKKA